jgi:predicted DNA-binding transcriptional regulator AlpA
MQILTIKEVSKLVKLSVETIRKLRKIGKFPIPKQTICRGKLLWLLTDIEDWIKNNV